MANGKKMLEQGYDMLTENGTLCASLRLVNCALLGEGKILLLSTRVHV